MIFVIKIDHAGAETMWAVRIRPAAVVDDWHPPRPQKHQQQSQQYH
ncbi:MAG: hypothetical protein V3W44_09900 [Dehalococcoidales bacterium]